MHRRNTHQIRLCKVSRREVLLGVLASAGGAALLQACGNVDEDGGDPSGIAVNRQYAYWTTDVLFTQSTGTERDIVCGGPADAAGTLPGVVRVGAYFPRFDGDVPNWLVIKPGSERLVLGEVWATLQFGGSQTSFNNRCHNQDTATLYLAATEPFTVNVRFSP